MNPLRLQAVNLRTYPSLDWAIPEGTTAITGPNGAGKSTLLGAIELALFADGSRDLAPALGPYGERLEITLEFEHAGELYRVRRGYTGGTRGKATLDLEQLGWDGEALGLADNWYPRTRESAAATQALIESTLGLTRSTFNASAFLAQGNAGAFAEAAPAERKALLGAILDPHGLWPRLSARAASERKTVEAELLGTQARMADRAELAGQASHLTDALTGAKAAHGDARRSLEDTDGVLERARAAVAANAAGAERLRAATQARLEAENRRDNAQDSYWAAREQAENVAPAQERLAELDAIAATVPELEAKAEAQSKTLQEAALARERKQAAERHAAQLLGDAHKAHEISQRYAHERETLEGQIAHLEDAADGTERCSLCAQILGAEARAATLAALDDRLIATNVASTEHIPVADKAERSAREAEQAANAIQVPDVPSHDYSTPLAHARRASEERAGLQVAIEGYEREAAKLPGLEAAVRDAEHLLAQRTVESARIAAEQQDGAALEQAAASARAEQQTARSRLDVAQADLVRAQEALARAEQAGEELAALRNQTSETNTRLDTLKLAERICGRDGCPALIAENTVESIEAEANRILERPGMTVNGAAYRVEFRTQRALKGDASALRETLDILVHDCSSAREYLTYSGGERFRVSFALRWALARLLANRRGAESRLLVIDEPDGLDAEGMDGLAAVLREEAGGFDRVLMVSHNPLLASAFEQVVEVVSDGEVSRLVGSATEEGA